MSDKSILDLKPELFMVDPEVLNHVLKVKCKVVCKEYLRIWFRQVS